MISKGGNQNRTSKDRQHNVQKKKEQRDKTTIYKTMKNIKLKI
jgi:hypothetical protein